MVMGMAATRKITASSGESDIIRISPITMLTSEEMNMIEPKANQRRSRFRSAMARDCSWPAPQAVWKLAGRCCSLSKSVVRIDVSASEAGGMTKMRRRKNRAASSRPSPRISPAAPQTAPESAPSASTELTSSWITWGMISATMPAPTAERRPRVQRRRMPWRYGSSRRRAWTRVRRRVEDSASESCESRGMRAHSVVDRSLRGKRRAHVRGATQRCLSGIVRRSGGMVSMRNDVRGDVSRAAPGPGPWPPADS